VLPEELDVLNEPQAGCVRQKGGGPVDGGGGDDACEAPSTSVSVNVANDDPARADCLPRRTSRLTP
jgi:hypothetical protein